jgi:hypothetical protein
MSMTNEAMWAVVRRHMDRELAEDVAGSLATMVPEPFYEYHPLGYRIQGHAAISVMYRRMWAAFYPYVVASESLTLGTGSTNSVWYGENSVAIQEWARIEPPGAEVQLIGEIALFHFEGELLKGETIYCNGPLTQLTREALGADFLTLPGVSLLY